MSYSEKQREYLKKYYEKNKEKIKEHRKEYLKEYREKNKEKFKPLIKEFFDKTQSKTKKTAFSHKNKYTEEEIELIMSEKTIEEIALEIGRTYQAVAEKRHRIRKEMELLNSLTKENE